MADQRNSPAHIVRFGLVNFSLFILLAVIVSGQQAETARTRGLGASDGGAFVPAGERPAVYPSGNTQSARLEATQKKNAGKLPGAPSVSFLPAVVYGSGSGSPGSLVVKDVDGDGKADIVVANWGTNSIGILLGNGDGTFQPTVINTVLSTVGEWNALAVADVNNDGRSDFIVSTCCEGNGDNAAAVLLSNGNGTFQSPVLYDLGGTTLSSIAVADVNGDGKPDIVSANYNGSNNSTVTVLLGNGDGTFQPPIASAAPVDAGCLVVADVNKDGKADALVCSENTIAVLLGNGDGTFQSFTNMNFVVGYGMNDPAVVDVNGDGLPDMLAPNCGLNGCNSQGYAGILVGNGNGTFQSEVDFAVPITSLYGDLSNIATADVNGDSQLDIVVGNGMFSIPGQVAVLPGNGDGTFQPAVVFSTGASGAFAVAAVDVNGDAQADIVTANFGSGSVSVLINNSVAVATTTSLSSSINPSVYGQTVTLTAQVTSNSGTPTGTVQFLNGSTVVGSGTLVSGMVSIPVSILPAGRDSIVASYLGGGGFAASKSSPLTQTITKASTATSLSSSLNPAATGQAVTFTATVTGRYGGAATGTVTFLNGSQSLGSSSLSGNQAALTTSFATAGTYSITAQYSGDSNNIGSTSSALREEILTSTTTSLNSSLNPSVVGQPVTFTATVTSSKGTPPNGENITFYNGSTVMGTAPLSGGAAALTTSTLPAGVFTITASYPGDSNFAASISPGLRQVVNATTKSATSTTLASNLNPSTYGEKVTFTAVVTTTGPLPPTGTVMFMWSGYSIGSATLNSSGIATLTRSKLNADPYPLTAVYKGDGNNLGSTSPVLNQTVLQTTSAAALSSSPNPSVQGEAVTFSVKVTSPTVVPTGPVTFTAGATVLSTVQLSGGKASYTTTSLPTGSTTVKVTFSGDSNIKASSATVTQVVQP